MFIKHGDVEYATILKHYKSHFIVIENLPVHWDMPCVFYSQNIWNVSSLSESKS